MLYSYIVVRKSTKSGAEYNIKLIGQPTNYFKLSAAVIGISRNLQQRAGEADAVPAGHPDPWLLGPRRLCRER
jgi:hypothetical protein